MKIVIDPCYHSFAEYLESIPERFEEDGELIYSGRNQLRRFVIDGKSFVVKRFKLPHVINRIAYVTVRTSKACRSYEYAKRLLADSILTPVPVAYMETYNVGLSYSYYVSEEEKIMQELRYFYYHPDSPDLERVMDAFGRFTGQLHEKKILHKDYSAGNVLYKIDEKQDISFALVDLNRMNFGKSISEEEGYKNLERLCLSDEAYTYIAKAYARQRGFDSQYAIDQILNYKNKYK